MKTYSCDSCGEVIEPPQVSTFRLAGPARSMLSRAETHLCKLCVHPFAALVNVTFAPPPDLAATADPTQGTPSSRPSPT